MLDVSYYIAFSLSLFAIGMYCLATKRNMIRLILGIELLLNAANILFLSFSAYALPGYVDPLGQSFVIISIGIAGSVSAVALTLIVYVYKQYNTLDVRELRHFKG